MTDTNCLNNSILCDQTVKELLQEFADDNELVYYEVQTGDQSVKGDNYLAKVVAVKIIGKDKHDQDKTLSAILKVASRNDFLRAQMPLDTVYARETYVYRVLFPAFKQLEVKRGLIPTLVAPQFYKGSLKDKNEALLMENLRDSGYKMHDRMKQMNAEHVKLVLRKYAELHALSFALRDQNMTTFKQITESLDEHFVDFLRKCNFIEVMEHYFRKAVQSLNGNVDQEVYRFFMNKFGNVDSYFREVQASVADAYSVVLHGDCWITNIMFKYDKDININTPSDVRFIDFQLSRVAPPVLDIAYFFYSSSEKEIINNYEDYLKIYYNSLSSHLVKLGSNPDKVYPYSVLIKQWKKYAKFGLVMATIVLYIMLTEAHEAADVTKAAEANQNVDSAFIYDIAKIDLYYERVRPLLLHFAKNNLI